MIKNSKIFLIRPFYTLYTPFPLIYITFFHRYKNNIYHKIREMKNGGLMDRKGNLGGLFFEQYRSRICAEVVVVRFFEALF